MKYCLVKDGAIFKYNVQKPKIVTGTVDGVYLPLEDNVPSIDTATQRIAGSTYEIQTDKVVKTYTVVDIPQEEILATKAKQLEVAIEKHILDKCVELGYTTENHIAKYLVEGNDFYEEAKALSLWIGKVWAKSNEVANLVKSGDMTIPTEEELIAMLPVYEGGLV